MEELQPKKKSDSNETPREIFDEILERSKEMDAFVDDHQGLIIGDRNRNVEKESTTSENQ